MNKHITLEGEIIGQALENLKHQTQIEGVWIPAPNDLGIDGKLRLKYKKKQVTFYVEIKKDLRQYHLDKLIQQAVEHQPLILIAETIAPAAKKRLKENRIAYLEVNGNTHIENDGWLIQIDTNLAVANDKRAVNRAFTKTGLKLIFHLLYNPGAINDPYRKLAEETGIALGNITYIIDGLKEANYILPLNKNEIRLKNIPALLERWITGYRETLRPTLYVGTFHFGNIGLQENWQIQNVKDFGAVWGGEPAGDLLTNYLKPERFQLYIGENVIPLQAKLRLVPDKNGNVDVFRQFWRKENDPPELYAPPLLVYTDLLITEEPRCIETANKIYDKYLKHALEGA